MRPSRVLLAAALVQLGVGAALALVRAAPHEALPDDDHAVALAAGLALLALAVGLAVAPAFAGREPRDAAPALLAAALVLAGNVPLARGSTLLLGAGLAACAFLLPLALLRGRPVDGHAGLFAPDAPHRAGDRMSLVLLATGLGGLLVGGLLLAVPPRGTPSAGLAVLVLAGILPLATGVLSFLLPRLANRPLPGVTFLAASLVLLLGGAAGLAVAFSFPLGARFREPAALVLLAHAFALASLARLSLADGLVGPGPRARPFVRGAAVLAALAGVALLLALADRVPNDLLPLALYAHLALALLALCGALAAAGPFLDLHPATSLAWAKAGAALVIAGLFLLAPSFQYPRSPFPGALVLVLGGLCCARAFLAGASPAAPRAARRKKR